MRFCILGLFFVHLCASGSDARTWYVRPDSTGDAPTIQAAMDSAQSGDDVLLAPGTYSWTTQGTGGTSFGESMVEVRPGVSLQSEAGPESTILDGEFRARVILCRDVGDVRIEGITVMRGWSASSNGGGIYTLGSARPTISNCIVRDNKIGSGLRGAGIGCENPGVTIVDCRILDNIGVFDVGGGGVYIVGGSVSHCVIQGHELSGDSRSKGGAILAFDSSISDCSIEHNSSGNVFSGTGGGVYLVGTTSVTRCTFVENVTSAGGGRAWGGGLFCLQGECTITDCVFVRNLASGAAGLGGAIAALNMAQVMIMGCTLVANEGRGTPAVGGIYVEGAGSVGKTIVAWSEGAACSGPITFSCTDFYGNSLGDAFCGTDGGGNFSADPQFCADDPSSSLNVWLQQDSPCVPGNDPGGGSCGLIGARAVGCGTVLVGRRTWTQVKLMYRR